MTRPRFECVRPCEQDIRLIYSWRNDPITLAMSMSSKPKPWEEFYSNFLEDYFSVPALPPLMILEDKERVGYVLFRSVVNPFYAHRSCADISICIAPKHRQKGIATKALAELTHWLKRRDIDDILAEIKVQNEGSVRAFKAAEYEYIDTVDDYSSGKRVPLYRYWLTVQPNDLDEVFIIAEAGSNWKAGNPEEDEARAKKMIECAAEAGASAIKFQTFRAESVYAPNAGQCDYLPGEDIGKLFKNLEMPYELIPKLATWCQEQDIEFMSSVFSLEDYAEVDPYVKRHKLASYEISHLRLIEVMAKSGKPLLMSTGASELSDISWALEMYRTNGGRDVTLMQCTAQYPAALTSLNLRSIPSLRARYHVPVGLSDHSIEPLIAPLAAVGLGARVIEKHFTLDRAFKGPDHPFAVEPSELCAMVAAIREMEKSLGDGEKRVLEDEQELFHFARRRLQAMRAIEQGEILKENENFAILRSGSCSEGEHPMRIGEIEEKRAVKRIEAGEGIRVEDVE